MANDLVTSKTIVRRNTVHYSVSEVTSPTLYASIIAGTSKLPQNSFVTLITTAGVRTTKMSPDSPETWNLSESITLSSATVSTALSTKASIAALALVTAPNGSDPATTQTLANANKVAINAVIAALKTA